jgi:hypothetical protein
VSTHFYKVIYDSISQDAIAFLVPHRAISKGDFNNLLNDAVEDNVEGMW